MNAGARPSLPESDRKRILVLGASGRVGRRFCALALQAGHRVRGFSRSIVAEGELLDLEAVVGDVQNRSALANALDGVDVVVSSIGMDRGSDFPWARIRVPTDIHSSTTGFLVDAMAERGIGRFVLVSAHGVGDSWSQVSLPIRALIASSSIGVAYRDLGRAEAVLAGSDLDWTAVRPTVLADGPGTGSWRAERTLDAGMFGKIPREDVARFLLETVEANAWVGQRVSITQS